MHLRLGLDICIDPQSAWQTGGTEASNDCVCVCVSFMMVQNARMDKLVLISALPAQIWECADA